jgi:hypothetical protein
VDAPELAALKAVVYGRDAEFLPPSERAELEQRLARLLADEDSVRLNERAQLEAEAAELGASSESGAPAIAGNEAPDTLESAQTDGIPSATRGSTRSRLRWHTLVIGAIAAAVLTVGITTGIQRADRPESLQVFDVPAGESDSVPIFAHAVDVQSRFLDRLAGHDLFGLLRPAGDEMLGPGTETEQVCLFVVNNGGGGSGGACVPLAVFAEDGIQLGVDGSGGLGFTWGPSGSVRLLSG